MKTTSEDKVLELADDLMLARVAHLNEAGDAVVWHNEEVEAIIRKKLRPLLEAARLFACRIHRENPSPYCQNCTLAAELKGWRAGQEEAG